MIDETFWNAEPAPPLTAERMRAGFDAIRDMKYQPEPHILHPRYLKGEWTRCSCGWWHRRVNGADETAPVWNGDAFVWPDDVEMGD